jgi:glycosyltransferase involved in cell wall biosynthesis
MSVIRVAFIFEVFDPSWMGGLNYYRNLISATSEFPECKIEVVVFTGNEVQLHGIETNALVVRHGLFDKGSLLRNFRRLMFRLLRKDLLLHRLLLQYNIDVVSHYGHVGFSIPALTWIPDFQHLRLPVFFDAHEVRRRHASHSDLFKFGDAVLLSSNSALKDMECFFPDATIDRYVLSFASGVPSAWTPISRDDLNRRYHLGESWFHLPNQFWKHKNHEVVIQALELVNQSGVNLTVVATGSIADPRNPDHSILLNNKIQELGLERNFIILGSIPYDDMLNIMYHSIAVINPSLFEGWSSSVEEGKSLGKKLLLSNIDVHIEQSPDRVDYFFPESPQELAYLLIKANENYSRDAEDSYSRNSLTRQRERRMQFINSYREILEKIVGRN